jgi:hypothetical protein
MNMNLRFYIDPETDLPHIYNHDVIEQEVQDIFNNLGEDRLGRDGSRVAIGQTQSGRYLKIIYVPEPETNSAFIITAYQLIGKPLNAYRKRKRRK